MTAPGSQPTQSQATTQDVLSSIATQVAPNLTGACLIQQQQAGAHGRGAAEVAAMSKEASPAPPQPDPIEDEPYIMQYDKYNLPLTLLDWRRAPLSLDGTAK